MNNSKKNNSVSEYDSGYGSDFEYDEKTDMIKHKKPKISNEIEYDNNSALSINHNKEKK